MVALTKDESLRKMKSASPPSPSSKIVVKRCGGGTLIDSRPVFSSDAKYIYLNCGWGVRVFSVGTGECVKSFDALTGSETVVSVLCIDNKPCAVTGNGVFLKWEPKSGTLLKKEELGLSSKLMAADALLVPNLKEPNREDLCIPFVDFNLNAKLGFFSTHSATRIPKHPLNDLNIDTWNGKHSICFGGRKGHPIFAYIHKNKLRVHSVDGKLVNKMSATNGRTWTCVRCHPVEESVAVGDDTGRIVLWRSPFAKKSATTVYHWHTLTCQDIAFTPFGSSMFSGGFENVLVKWNLENPDVRNYLPRLSAPIAHINISPHNQLVAVSTVDNGIQIVEPQSKLKCVLQQLAWGVVATPDTPLFPAGMCFDPRTRSLVLNGRSGHLQFYVPDTETLLFNIDITQKNYLTQERDKVIVNTEVTHSAISSDGSWLATVETRCDPHSSLELQLKFWNYIMKKKCFNLNSCIDLPHNGKVRAIDFKPGLRTLSSDADSENLDYMLVTTGEDKKFRIWTPHPIDSIYRKGVVWYCDSVGFYREKYCGPASFSEDGSLLAVGFESCLTVWDTVNVHIKTTLTTDENELKLVAFGRWECSHLIVSATNNDLCAWNVLTLRLLWRVSILPSILVSDQLSCYMAVFTEDNRLFLFRPSSSEPVYRSDKVCKRKAGRAVCATFMPRDGPLHNAPIWTQESQLFYMDSFQEMHCYHVEGEGNQMSAKLYLTEDEAPGTLFSALVASQTLSEAKFKQPNKSLPFGILGASEVTQLLKAPAHTMPPVNRLCSTFLRSLVHSKKKGEERDNGGPMESEETDADSSMSEQDDIEPSKSRYSPLKPPKKLINFVEDLGVIDLDVDVGCFNGSGPVSASRPSKAGSDLFFVDLNVDQEEAMECEDG